MTQLFFTAYDNDARPRSGTPAGRISFSSGKIALSKIAGGALLRLDYTICLHPGLRISISNITGEVGLVGTPSPLALGVAVDPRCHVIDTDHEARKLISSSLRLPLSLAALETAERFRDGRPPELEVVLQGSVLVQDKTTGQYEGCRLEVDGGLVRFNADRDNWIQQVRNVSPLGSVLIEIPLAVERPAPWGSMWKGLDSASANLVQGGEIGWKNCVSEVRQALDVWRKIDNFQARPSQAEKEKEKDKRQRLYDVANALFHYCSLSVHADEHQESWTRADAILALSTLCALLSVRNP